MFFFIYNVHYYSFTNLSQSIDRWKFNYVRNNSHIAQLALEKGKWLYYY